MISFIARYFSSLWELITYPFRIFWKLVIKLFPPRDCVIMDTPSGKCRTYQESSFWRFTKFCVYISLFLWATWSTYIFVYHRPLLQKRTQQLEEAREQHDRQMEYLKTYFNKYNELARNLNILDNKILNADKTQNSESDTESLLNTKSKILGELDFLHTKVSEMMTNENYQPEFDTLATLSIEFELVRNENNSLKAQHEQILENMTQIAIADKQIIDGVSKLTSDNISELQQQLQQIDATLVKLGITQDKLVERANNYSDKHLMIKYVPIKIDKNANSIYKKISQDIEQWNGLYRITQILPIGAPLENPSITSKYGVRKDPFTGKKKNHKGIDFSGKIGTELYAVAPGRVISAGERSGYGYTVEIDHGLGFTTLYAHLSKMSVSRGDWVRPGSMIGLGGSSGRSTGPHLHYEIRYKGTPFDPTTFIKGN